MRTLPVGPSVELPLGPRSVRKVCQKGAGPPCEPCHWDPWWGSLWGHEPCEGRAGTDGDDDGDDGDDDNDDYDGGGDYDPADDGDDDDDDDDDAGGGDGGDHADNDEELM
eukprot:8343173-Pyramimonas_sp.AAC.1